jgi:hypothetical protein
MVILPTAVCARLVERSALLSSVNGRASKDFRTGCKNTVKLLVKINILQLDDCVDTFTYTARGLNALHSA